MSQNSWWRNFWCKSFGVKSQVSGKGQIGCKNNWHLRKRTMLLLIGEKFLTAIKKCEKETFDLSKNLSWANHLHSLMDFPIPSPQIFPWNVLHYISFAFHHKSFFVFFFNNLFRAVSIVSPGSSNPPGNPNLPSNLNKALPLFVCLKMVLPKMHVYEGIVRMLTPKFFFSPATIVN